MRRLLSMGVLGLLTGCALNLLPGTNKLAPEFENSATQDIIVQEWVSGFVPADMAKREILSINGLGDWRVERQHLNDANASASIVASGSITVLQLQRLIEQAYSPVSSTHQNFMNLPAQLPSQMTDVPLRSIAMNLKGGTFKVEDPGSGNETFQDYYGAIASATIALPLNN